MTHFGKKKVGSLYEKTQLVQNLFSKVSSKYDLMNHIMSFYLHKKWKDILVSEMPYKKLPLLDMASGTGDVATKYMMESYKRYGIYPRVISADLNFDMLKKGKDEKIDTNMRGRLNYLNCNAEAIPIKNNSVGYYSIAFGIRNVSDVPKALTEAYRVLDYGGKFLCMEFAQANNQILDTLYSAHKKLIPILGKLVANDYESYEYLIDSINQFPKQKEFRNMIKSAGFSNVGHIDILSGIVSIYYGWKNES